MNPYQTPCDESKGKYDRSLLKRAVWFGLRFSLVMAFILMLFLYRDFSQKTSHDRSYVGVSSIEKVKSFFTDWNHSPLAD